MNFVITVFPGNPALNIEFHGKLVGTPSCLHSKKSDGKIARKSMHITLVNKKGAGGYVTHDQYDKELCMMIVEIFD